MWAQTVAVLLSAVFLAGTAGEVYGLHDCSHHRSAPAAPTDASSHAAGGEAASGPMESSSGPCTCLGTCHGAAAAPTTALGQETPVLEAGRTGRILRATPPEPAPARDVTVLLPYPTGPPAPVG